MPAIFFLASCAFGVGYTDDFLGWFPGLMAFTLAIEIAQLAIAGRHARLLDFVVDAASIGIGLVIGARLARFKPVSLSLAGSVFHDIAVAQINKRLARIRWTKVNSTMYRLAAPARLAGRARSF